MKVTIELDIDPVYCRESLGYISTAPIGEVITEAMYELFEDQYDSYEGHIPKLLSGTFKIVGVE